MSSKVSIDNLQTESLTDPIGIDLKTPRFSWVIKGESFGYSQVHYQIKVFEVSRGQRRLTWDSQKIQSNQTHHIKYGGEPLIELSTYEWQVSVWGEDGIETLCEKSALFTTAVFEDYAWQGKWIHYPIDNMLPSAYMRRNFEITKPVSEAFLLMSAKGIFEPYLNGERICEDFFMPGWTDYKKRQHYRLFNVSQHLDKGSQCLGAILSEGWFNGQVGNHKPNIYGNQNYLLCELHIVYEDGSTDLIVSDESWETAHGKYLQASIMHGEHVDARLDLPGWSKGNGAGDWKKVSVKPFDGEERTLGEPEPFSLGSGLRAHTGVPVRVVETFSALKVHEAQAGAYVYDFGQNMAGVVQLQLDLPAGTCLRIRHGEMTTPDGSLYTENLRSAIATDLYICKGGSEVYEPRFTYHGFQFVEISGAIEPLPLDKVKALALSSDTAIAGKFSCSNEMLNQLQSNIHWTQRSNFLEVPTDCPQRDERLGWTGDAQVFISTACGIADVEAFFRKWLFDMQDSQREDGSIPNVIPGTPMGGNADAAWGDAVTICPTELFRVYGDPEILPEWYPRMKAFCDFYENAVREDGTRGGPFCFGDWLALDVEDYSRHGGGTPKDLIQTAFYNWSNKLAADVARQIGKPEEAQLHDKRVKDSSLAFDRVYFNDEGKSLCDTQTSYVLALCFDLLPEEKRMAAIENLVENIKRNDNHLTTGFVGVSYLLPTLARFGQLDLAYQLLENETFPSWGYSIKNGATTIWERWNGWIKGEGPGDPKMNSYSHYAYGSVGAFLYQTVAGLRPLEPGYRKALISPMPGGNLAHASYDYQSIVGRWHVSWEKKDTCFECKFEVPLNASAKVELPIKGTDGILVNNAPIRGLDMIKELSITQGRISFSVGSGVYTVSLPN